jgi:uncharacterized protein involved in exopolysaccharide biosynthesis
VSDFVLEQLDKTVKISELLRVFWRRKFLIAGMFAFFVGASAALAFTLTPIYRAQSTLVLAGDDNSGLSSAVGQLGGIAALVGLGVPSGGNPEYVEFLRSQRMAVQFVKTEGILQELFPSRWDETREEWLDEPMPGEISRLFSRNVLRVIDDKVAGVIKVSIDWKDPIRAAEWANAFVTLANEELRRRAISEAERTRSVLESEVERAGILEVKASIYRLIESQIQIKALASVRSDYAFRVVDPALPPHWNNFVRPRRVLLLLMGVLGGLAVGLLSALVLPERAKANDSR